MTTTILIIVNVFAALAIIVLALMQQSKGDMGSAFGGGGSQSMFGSRGSANFLSRLTAIMCAVFFISSLSLAYLYAKRSENSSVIQSAPVEEVVQDAASSEVPTLDPIENASELPTLDAPVESDEVPTLDAIEQGASEVEAAIDSAIEQ